MTADSLERLLPTALVGRTRRLLNEALPGAELAVDLWAHDDHILVEPVLSADERYVPLHAGGERVARAEVLYRFLAGDSRETTLLATSHFRLFLDAEREPLVRIEYQRDATNTARSHWHVHAERGALSTLLTRTGSAGNRVGDPSRMSALHFPHGPAWSEPSLEDFVEFLVRECGVDARPGWADAVADYRTTARRIAVSLLTRASQNAAARTLRSAGWTVDAPEGATFGRALAQTRG